MCRILLVENETEWQDLIRRALPAYQVDQAGSYDEALALLAGGVGYDLAIVDLNLLDKGHDLLGGEVLKIMKQRYSSTRRIALTGVPLTAVRRVLEQYAVDDLLLKKGMDLAVVRETVESALRRRVLDDVPGNLRARQAEMRTSLVAWLSRTAQRMDRRAHTLQNDVENAARVGKMAADSATELEALKARRDDLEMKCSEFLGLLTGIRSDQDLEHAQREFENLKQLFAA
jgi:CheY-like chemotaxis protein